MAIPVILGQPLHHWLGMSLLIMVAFQILSGKGWLKIPFIYHRRMGVVIGLVAVIHGFMGMTA